MTTSQIKSRLKKNGVPFDVHDREWFMDCGGEIGDCLSGVTVPDEESWEKAVIALGADLDDARSKLEEWKDWHLVELEGYPVVVEFIAKYDEDDPDDEATDCGEFSII